MPHPKGFFFITMNNISKVAILIDGGFFIKRYPAIFPQSDRFNAEEVAEDLYSMALRHVGKDNTLYRIFYYDCHPLTKRVHHPITKKAINFEQTDASKFRLQLFEQLKKRRKTALRLGTLKDSGHWVLHPSKTKDLFNGKLNVNDIAEKDVTYEIRQKGIDMKIGLDIASLAYKKLVDQIVLISGDADFVPASKLARIEGIDFVLDPLWNPIDAKLFEHIDGLRSTCAKPTKNNSETIN